MPRRNQEKPPQHSSLCWYFGYDTIITINKTKNKQVRIHQTEKTPHMGNTTRPSLTIGPVQLKPACKELLTANS